MDWVQFLENSDIGYGGPVENWHLKNCPFSMSFPSKIEQPVMWVKPVPLLERMIPPV